MTVVLVDQAGQVVARYECDQAPNVGEVVYVNDVGPEGRGPTKGHRVTRREWLATTELGSTVGVTVFAHGYAP